MKSHNFLAILALIVVALAISACGPSPEEQTVTAAALTAAATNTPTNTPYPTSTPVPTLTPTPSSLFAACINDIASYSGLDSNALQEFIIRDIFQTFPEFDLFGQPEEFLSECIYYECFYVFSPAWSPNERQIAFSAGVGSGEMFINIGIFILEEGSSEINRLVPDREAVEILLRSLAEKYGWTEERTNEIPEIMGIAPWAVNPVWSPDGTKIAFPFGFGLGSHLGEIWVINADGSGLIKLTSGFQNGAINPKWSPDSQQIIFTTRPFTFNHIVRVNADGSELTRLTSEDAYYESASWSPDGQQIVFVASPEKTRGIREFANIYIMNADGSGLINLTSGLEIGAINPKWTQDGQQILFNSIDYDYYAVNIDGTNLTSTTRDPSVYAPDRFQCPAFPLWPEG
jgi:Tol biopolymer transport system component